MQGCKPDTDRLTERAAAATQAWLGLQESSAILLCTGYASQAGRRPLCVRNQALPGKAYHLTQHDALQDFQQKPISLVPKQYLQACHLTASSLKTRLRTQSRMP